MIPKNNQCRAQSVNNKDITGVAAHVLLPVLHHLQGQNQWRKHLLATIKTAVFV